MSAHKSPEQIRSQLKHPVVDGDGHWLEYAPVFSEKMRKAAGDKSAEGFLAALRSTTDALKMTPEERRRRRVAMPNFWNRQAENTLDRATGSTRSASISRSFIRPPGCACRASRTTRRAAPSSAATTSCLPSISAASKTG
jgi:hypothetical protein